MGGWSFLGIRRVLSNFIDLHLIGYNIKKMQSSDEHKDEIESVEMNPLEGLEAMRASMNQFVRERDWNQFHTPSNILLALCGEVGEVCECFQWKGNLDGFIEGQASFHNFAEKEVVHIGEEIADVLAYTTRLAEELRIDLGAAVLNRINKVNSVSVHCTDTTNTNTPNGSTASGSASVQMDSDTVSGKHLVSTKWRKCTFDILHTYARRFYKTHRRSPRYYAMLLHHTVGNLTFLFARRPEAECVHPWQQWVEPDLRALVDALTDVLVCMAGLANIMGLQLGVVMADKIAKNYAKYPADAVRGSAAKYNTYKNGGGGSGGSKLYVKSVSGEEISKTKTKTFAGPILAVVAGAISALFIVSQTQ